MFEQIILGTIQGIAEWLPVSSEGMLILAQKHLLGRGGVLRLSIEYALFLHFGTFLAAFIYFFKDIRSLVLTLFTYKKGTTENKKILSFLFISTLISGCVGIALLKGLLGAVESFEKSSMFLTLAIGVFLCGTAALQLKVPTFGERRIEDLTILDAIILGFVQGFSALPGFSRSGLTVSALLFSKFDKKCALRLSFLMSLPIVLGGNIVLQASSFGFSAMNLVGLVFSFIFGLATIHALLKVTEEVNFGYFVLVFGLLTIISAFI